MEGDRIAEVTGRARLCSNGNGWRSISCSAFRAWLRWRTRFAKLVEGTGCTVLDTRKDHARVFANWRRPPRKAGGVTNHRMGLYDAILIKNNHIAAAEESVRRS